MFVTQPRTVTVYHGPQLGCGSVRLRTVRDSLCVAWVQGGKKGSHADFEKTLEHYVRRSLKPIVPFRVSS